MATNGKPMTIKPGVVVPSLSTEEQRNRLREKLARDVDSFLKKGGTVVSLPGPGETYGMTRDPVRPLSQRPGRPKKSAPKDEGEDDLLI
ncbi:MAG: hypothetical protein MUE60_15155 [Candidatus Eisenbacteria bacterium]|jgi:hypothetical protein|nr:hypothetical protein [Candidatus Eisenbacteria bacterium]